MLIERGVILLVTVTDVNIPTDIDTFQSVQIM